MTPISGTLSFFTFCFSAWMTTVAGRRMTPEGPPRIEIVAGGRMGQPKLEKRGNASVEYIRYTAQAYNALASIGPYAFLLSLDTGSSDTWVVSSDCSTAECRGLPTYPTSLSSPTYEAVSDNTTAFHIGFADETVADGFVARERLVLGGFTLNAQVFGLVNDTNVTLSSGESRASGVLGLGFPRLSSIRGNVPGAIPAIARLAQQGDLSYPMFGLSLRKNDTGTLSLGAIDVGVVSNLSAIAWHNVAPFPTLATDNSSIYLQWAIRMSSVSAGGQRIGINSTYPKIVGRQPLALLDLGTNGMFGPAEDVGKIFGLIPASRLVGDGQYAVPCDTTLSMSFAFGSRNYTLQPHDYIFAQAQDPPNMCLAWPRATSPSNDGIDWQLGTPFLRTVYSVFSYGIDNKEPPKIGLYPLPSVANDTTETVSYSLSAELATFATTLPNYVLPTPTYTTPPYLFSPFSSGTSLSSATSPVFTYYVPTLGQLEHSGLGVSTYTALVTRSSGVLLPTQEPPFTVITDSSGSRSTQPVPIKTMVLGGPEISAGRRADASGGGIWTLAGLFAFMYIRGYV